VTLAVRRLPQKCLARVRLVVGSALLWFAPASAAKDPAVASASEGETFRRELALALAHYRERRFSEARDAFERALGAAPAGESRENLEFDIAACDYELGNFPRAEERFARLAERSSAPRIESDEAFLHAGWAALGADDVSAAERYLARTEPEGALADERSALARGIDERRKELDARAFDQALAKATAAYDAGDLAGAEAALAAARAHEPQVTPSSRAALEYLAGLLFRERGDDVAARAAFERSLSENPNDGSVLALLGELELASGDTASAESHYRASLAADLSPDEADAVHRALDALYPVPRAGFAAWAALGGGYDSNAAQSGSTDTVGYAAPNDQGSPFVAPALGIEYRFEVGQRSRLVPYYSGDWLVLSRAAVEEASLQSHEAGVRWHWAPSPSLELRLVAGGGTTLSGFAPSPFSLDGLSSARVALQHGPSFQTALLVEARPSLGLSGRDYLTGARSEAALGERFESGPWGVSVSGGFRYSAIGTQHIGIDPALYPNCNVACVGARYDIPLGYSGPIASAAVDVELIPGLELTAAGKYEHRTYLAESRITGPMPFGLVGALSRKIRVDDRYTLSGRARYRIASAPEIGMFVDYSLRLSRSNMALGRSGLEHAFDYDDRNFSQQIIELGLDVRR
jgi:tetratricopeptide (TPR) repeat protein